MKAKLDILRDQLQKINEELFTIIKERRGVVERISKEKSSINKIPKYSNWDPAREWELFNRHLRDLGSLTAEEIFAFSLVIESQAGTISKYPRWSKREHIESEGSHSIMGQINPLLVALIFPEEFKKISIKKEITHHISIIM